MGASNSSCFKIFKRVESQKIALENRSKQHSVDHQRLLFIISVRVALNLPCMRKPWCKPRGSSCNQLKVNLGFSLLKKRELWNAEGQLFGMYLCVQNGTNKRMWHKYLFGLQQGSRLYLCFASKFWKMKITGAAVDQQCLSYSCTGKLKTPNCWQSGIQVESCK